MNLKTKIVVSSQDLIGGRISIPVNTNSSRIFVDFLGFNTIYNIPSNTSLLYNGSEISIATGYYSINNIVSMLSTMISAINPDSNVYKDTNLGKIVFTGNTSSGTIDTRGSSDYLCSLIGLPKALYTGSTVESVNIPVLYPGTGFWVNVSDISYKIPPIAQSISVPFGISFVPWDAYGGLLRNYDYGIPKSYPVVTNQDINNISISIRDCFNNEVFFNGSIWTIIIGLLDETGCNC